MCVLVVACPELLHTGTHTGTHTHTHTHTHTVPKASLDIAEEEK